jgi:hypothetical protein
MSAADKARVLPACQALYLHSGSSRRLKSAAASTAGAAGLSPDTRFAGRFTPLKGKGAPPADNKDASYARSSIRTMPETHNKNSINVVRPDASAPAKARRSAVRVLEASHASSVKGAAALVATEVGGRRGAGCLGFGRCGGRVGARREGLPPRRRAAQPTSAPHPSPAALPLPPRSCPRRAPCAALGWRRRWTTSRRPSACC